jgi:hypothetical protein
MYTHPPLQASPCHHGSIVCAVLRWRQHKSDALTSAQVLQRPTDVLVAGDATSNHQVPAAGRDKIAAHKLIPSLKQHSCVSTCS